MQNNARKHTRVWLSGGWGVRDVVLRELNLPGRPAAELCRTASVSLRDNRIIPYLYQRKPSP